MNSSRKELLRSERSTLVVVRCCCCCCCLLLFKLLLLLGCCLLLFKLLLLLFLLLLFYRDRACEKARSAGFVALENGQHARALKLFRRSLSLSSEMKHCWREYAARRCGPSVEFRRALYEADAQVLRAVHVCLLVQCILHSLWCHLLCCCGHPQIIYEQLHDPDQNCVIWSPDADIILFGGALSNVIRHVSLARGLCSFVTSTEMRETPGSMWHFFTPMEVHILATLVGHDTSQFHVKGVGPVKACDAIRQCKRLAASQWADVTAFAKARPVPTAALLMFSLTSCFLHCGSSRWPQECF